MIPHLSPLHGPTKREFARRPLRFALRWKKEPHNKDQAPITTKAHFPSRPTDLFSQARYSCTVPTSPWTNPMAKTFLKDSLPSTL
jgi:hypothetical protein